MHIDLLLTDVGLPGGMNGRPMADAAKSSRPDLKVLFITGYAENAALNHGHLAPGMESLVKPIALEALATRIRGLIERAISPPARGFRRLEIGGASPRWRVCLRRERAMPVAVLQPPRSQARALEHIAF